MPRGRYVHRARDWRERKGIMHMAEETPRKMRSIKSVSEETGISRRTIGRLIANGKLKGVRLSERRIGIPSDEAQRLVTHGVAA